MEKIIIDGGNALHGQVSISGMKNAATPIIFACIAVDDVCVIENLPRINDVEIALNLVRSVGGKVRFLTETSVEIDTRGVEPVSAPCDLVRKIRGSYYLIGAMLARFGRAMVALPGGCDIGARPIDQHIKAFEALGASVMLDSSFIEARTETGLCGNHIYFDCVTVGGTINAILAAVKAKGQTVIENAAREPHVVDVANFLNYCGANISGAGTGTVKIRGVERLSGCTYAVIPDMIEAGTFMMAAAATGGRLYIRGVIPKHLEATSAKMIEMGVSVEEMDDAVLVTRKGPLSPVNIKTLPYPGFPTDMNPQVAVLLCLASGVSRLSETVYENRFRYTEELRRMGAHIQVERNTAVITGTDVLHGASVRAVDLRAGAAMVIAGLAAEGRTVIDDIFHMERGYVDMVGKIRSVGGNIRKVVIPVSYDKEDFENGGSHERDQRF